jgi:predicted RNA-binding Zn-ribbon protein involved in translation (DUF1610 family)
MDLVQMNVHSPTFDTWFYLERNMNKSQCPHCGELANRGFDRCPNCGGSIIWDSGPRRDTAYEIASKRVWKQHRKWLAPLFALVTVVPIFLFVIAFSNQEKFGHYGIWGGGIFFGGWAIVAVIFYDMAKKEMK